VDLVAIQKYQNIYIKIYELLVGRIKQSLTKFTYPFIPIFYGLLRRNNI